MTAIRTIVITDRYDNSLMLTSDGADIKIVTSSAPDGPVEIDEVDRQKLRDFLNG